MKNMKGCFSHKLKQAGYTMVDTMMAVVIAGAGVTTAVVGAKMGMETNEVQQALQNVRTIQVRAEERYYPANDNSYAFLDDAKALEYGLIPDGMILDENGVKTVKNAFGGTVEVFGGALGGQRIVVKYHGIPKSACVSFATPFIRAGKVVRILPAHGIDGGATNWPELVKTNCDASDGKIAIKN